MSDQWGPWIEHCGTKVPNLIGHILHLVFEDGDEGVVLEGSDEVAWSKFGFMLVPDADDPWGWIWSSEKCEYGDAIVRYRIRKPRGLSMLEEIARDVTAPIKKVNA